ncbi:MAG: hypothetical protein ABSE49_26755 [Polyangiaceae bacterium]
MIRRPVLACVLLWTGCAGLAFGTAIGCSSASSPGTEGSADSGTGADSHAGSDSSAASDSGGGADTSMSNEDAQGVGLHDGGAPDALYGACAVMGSFGWPCNASATGPDPTDCTDPAYPDCFVGGQGTWCTKTCATSADCTQVEDAGCTPTACNNKGYCK